MVLLTERAKRKAYVFCDTILFFVMNLGDEVVAHYERGIPGFDAKYLTSSSSEQPNDRLPKQVFD